MLQLQHLADGIQPERHAQHRGFDHRAFPLLHRQRDPEPLCETPALERSVVRRFKHIGIGQGFLYIPGQRFTLRQVDHPHGFIVESIGEKQYFEISGFRIRIDAAFFNIYAAVRFYVDGKGFHIPSNS